MTVMHLLWYRKPMDCISKEHTAIIMLNIAIASHCIRWAATETNRKSNKFIIQCLQYLFFWIDRSNNGHCTRNENTHINSPVNTSKHDSPLSYYLSTEWDWVLTQEIRLWARERMRCVNVWKTVMRWFNEWKRKSDTAEGTRNTLKTKNPTRKTK